MSKIVDVTTTTKARRDASLPAILTSIEVPESVEEALEMWGSDVAYSYILKSATVAHQSAVRSRAVDREGNHLPAEQVSDLLADWRPTQRTAKATAAEKAALLIESLSPEDQSSIIAQLQANAAQRNGKGKKNS